MAIIERQKYILFCFNLKYFTLPCTGSKTTEYLQGQGHFGDIRYDDFVSSKVYSGHRLREDSKKKHCILYDNW